MNNARTYFTRGAWIALIGLTVFSAIKLAAPGTLSSAAQASAQAGKSKKSGEPPDEHAQFQAELQKVMTGPVDIYFDAAQVEQGTPRLAKLKFVDLVDVTGKHLLRFADEKGSHWLVDPDSVLTFCVHPTKQK